MTDEFTKERIAELRRWTKSRGSVPGMGIAKHVPDLLDAIERRDARIAEIEGIPATEIETRDPDKLLAIIRGMDVECVGAMNEAKRAREERDAALARVGELEAEVSNLWDSLDIAVKRHDTELFTAHANGIEAAAKHVEAHSCVSSCCDANPSSAEARALAACIRSGAPRNGPLVRVATGGEIVRAGTGETEKAAPTSGDAARIGEG